MHFTDELLDSCIDKSGNDCGCRSMLPFYFQALFKSLLKMTNKRLVAELVY